MARQGLSGLIGFSSTVSTACASIRPYFSHSADVRRGNGFWSAPQPIMNMACRAGVSLLDVDLRHAGVIARPLIEIHRRVVASVEKHHGRESAVGRADRQHRHAVVDGPFERLAFLTHLRDQPFRVVAAVDGEVGLAVAAPEGRRGRAPQGFPRRRDHRLDQARAEYSAIIARCRSSSG